MVLGVEKKRQQERMTHKIFLESRNENKNYFRI